MHFPHMHADNSVSRALKSSRQLARPWQSNITKVGPKGIQWRHSLKAHLLLGVGGGPPGEEEDQTPGAAGSLQGVHRKTAQLGWTLSHLPTAKELAVEEDPGKGRQVEKKT